MPVSIPPAASLHITSMINNLVCCNNIGATNIQALIKADNTRLYERKRGV